MLDDDATVRRDRVGGRVVGEPGKTGRDSLFVDFVAPLEVPGDGAGPGPAPHFTLRPARQLRPRNAAHLTDLPGDGPGDRDLLAGPGGNLSGRVLDGRDRHRLLLLVDLGDSPHLPALDEHLPRGREVDDEPLVEGPDPRAAGDVLDVVGGLVGDHREVLVEVLPGTAALLDAVFLLFQPDHPVAGQLANDRPELLRSEVAKRVGTGDDLVGAHRRHLAEVHHQPDGLVGNRIQRPIVDGRGLDLAVAGLAGNGHRLEHVVGVAGHDCSRGNQVPAVPRSPDTLEQAGDLPGTVVLDDVVDVAHVDPQLHRGGTEQRGEFAVLEPRLHVDTSITGQRAVVDAHVGAVLLEPRAQRLRRLSGVDEY